MDVYSEINRKYYANGANVAKQFTFGEVLEFRKRYITESAAEIYNSTDKSVSYDSFQKMLWGHTYKEVPVYNKKKKEWDFEGYINS